MVIMNLLRGVSPLQSPIQEFFSISGLARNVVVVQGGNQSHALEGPTAGEIPKGAIEPTIVSHARNNTPVWDTRFLWNAIANAFFCHVQAGKKKTPL